MSQCIGDEGTYTSKDSDHNLIIGTHVDDSIRCVGVFALDKTRRNYLTQSRRPSHPNLCRCVIRRSRGSIPDRSTHHTGEPSDRMVQQTAGCGLPINYGGRIHCGLRGSQGCSLEPAIPSRVRDHDDSQSVHRQRRSLGPEPDLQVCATKQHIDHQYHYIRQQNRSGKLTVKTIPGKDNPADILTKLIPMSSVNGWKKIWMSTSGASME